MFRWENPQAFQYLWLVPTLAVMTIIVWRRREANLNKAINSRLLPLLVGSRSQFKRKLKIGLEFLVVIAAVFALARPQFGESTQKIKSQGVELVVAIDVSNSMLAEDIKPSRLEHAKNEINRLLDRLSGDKVSLIAFAGSGVLLAPLTQDYGSVRLFLDGLQPNSVTQQGTNFTSVLDTAIGSFKRGGVDPDEGVRVTRVLLIVTDGEATEGSAIKTAEKAREQGIRIFTLGMGTRAGAPIPDRDEAGNLRGYKKDKSGKMVLSTANEEALTELAQAGGGAYYHSDFSGSATESIRKDIEKMEKSEFESDMMTNYDERFQTLLLIAILLALIELLLGERRKPGSYWRGRFETTAILFAIWCFSGFESAQAGTVDSVVKNRQGLKALQEGRLLEANKVLSDAAVDNPGEAGLGYNLGQTFEANEEKDKAMQSYIGSAQQAQDPELKFQALFNAARIAGDLKQMDQALNLYQSALDLKPDSVETKTNIELLMKSGGGGGGGDQKKEKNKGEGDQQDPQDDKDQKNPQPKQDQQQQKPKPKPFQSQEISQQDAKKILDELRRQEEQVRAKFNEKRRKETPVEKDW